MIPRNNKKKFIEKYGYKWYLRDFDYYPAPLENMWMEWGENQWDGVRKNTLKVFDNMNDAYLASYEVRKLLGLETRTKEEFFTTMLDREASKREHDVDAPKKLKVKDVVSDKDAIRDNRWNIIFELKHIYPDCPPEYDTVEIPVDAEIYKRLPQTDNDNDAFFRFVEKYLAKKDVITDDNTFVTRYVMVSGDSKAKIASREMIEKARKNIMNCIASDSINLDNMTEADYVEEYEKRRKDTLRVLCEIYSISPTELLRFLHKNATEKARRMYEGEFLANYGEPLFKGRKGMEVVNGGTICDKPLDMERYGIKDENAVKDFYIKPSGTVEIGYAGAWDFDDFTCELTRIETNYLGKTGEMDYCTFLAVLSHIRNVYEKLHKGEGLNDFEKKALIDANNKMTESGLPVCEVSGIAVDREPSPKGEIAYLDKGNRADKSNNLTSISVEKRDKLLDELKGMLNRYGIDTICNTPDFILADALLDTIRSIEKLQENTNWWFGRKHGEI